MAQIAKKPQITILIDGRADAPDIASIGELEAIAAALEKELAAVAGLIAWQGRGPTDAEIIAMAEWEAERAWAKAALESDRLDKEFPL